MLHAPGDIGAQQSTMTQLSKPLPWVPDVVGINSHEGETVTVVGSAYSPFLDGYCGRSAAMSLHSYVSAVHSRSWVQFQREFLTQVVVPDPKYYVHIPKLLQGVIGSDQMILLDLCRASFCERGSHPHHVAGINYEDKGGDAVALANPGAFRSHTESPIPSKWLWERLTASSVKCVIALGFLAEHGLLRLFWRNGFQLIRRHLEPRSSWSQKSATGWPSNRFAHSKFGSTWWTTKADWWDVTDQCQTRTWTVLPVPHPLHRNPQVRDESYRMVPAVLRAMLKA